MGLIDLKILGAILAGVFVGAAAGEVMKKKSPKSVEQTRDKAIKAVEATKKSFAAIKEAFKEGFAETAQGKAAS